MMRGAALFFRPADFAPDFRAAMFSYANPDQRPAARCGPSVGCQGTYRRERAARARRAFIPRHTGQSFILSVDGRTGGARLPVCVPPTSLLGLAGHSVNGVPPFLPGVP